MLVELGSSFDVASLGEIEQCLAAGAVPESLSFGNTVKKMSAIAAAYEAGVERFAFDSDSELDKLIAAAPGSVAFCRVLCDGFGAAWPLSRKFGCAPDFARRLLVRAAGRVCVPASRSMSAPSSLIPPLGIGLLPSSPIFAPMCAPRKSSSTSSTSAAGCRARTWSRRRRWHLRRGDRGRRPATLGPTLPGEIIIEPGRHLVADAGALRCEVVTVGRKSASDEHRWVYLDVGMFSGLAEVMGQAIRYPVVSGRPGSATGPVVLAGPTCDSADILYETVDYQLPLDLAPGDRLFSVSVGAYSTTYSTIGFNGFPPLDVEVLRPTGPPEPQRERASRQHPEIGRRHRGGRAALPGRVTALRRGRSGDRRAADPFRVGSHRRR